MASCRHPIIRAELLPAQDLDPCTSVKSRITGSMLELSTAINLKRIVVNLKY